jgi:hypothetical protein
MIQVNSSNIDSVDYDEVNKVLTVKFTTGATYLYRGPSPDLYRAFMASHSKGKFFHQMIRPIFQGIKQ